MALEKLPTGFEAYDYAYNDAMDRIEGQLADEEELAKRVLAWITCATTPLTVSELEHALAVEPEETQLDPENICPVGDMVSVCAGLVTIDEESSIIRLVHYTTQEYFERTQSHWFPDAEAYITSTCITYLSFRAFESGPCQTEEQYDERLDSNKLYIYACDNWGYHARKASPKCDDEIVNFLKCETKVEAAIEAWMTHPGNSMMRFSYDDPPGVVGVHLAAHYGLQGVLNALLDADCIDLEDALNDTPLCWAARAGHEAATLLLIEKGAKLDATGNDFMTPLAYAAKEGNEATVKILIEHGAELEAWDELGRTPLFHAVNYGHEAVARLLLENGAKIDAIVDRGKTPLIEAVFTGNDKAVVKLLLEHGADLEAKDDCGHSALVYATRIGDEAIVQLLLEHGANVESSDKNGRTPLFAAVEYNREDTVKLLLKHGAELEVKEKGRGRTPLLFAVDNRQWDMVRLLLENGAKLEVQNDDGETPISIATEEGHEDMVRLLLENGAKLEVQNDDGETPISMVTEWGREAILELLLEQGAHLKAREVING